MNVKNVWKSLPKTKLFAQKYVSLRVSSKHYTIFGGCLNSFECDWIFGFMYAWRI